jgi:Zn-finger nucleic acid-binding protein
MLCPNDNAEMHQVKIESHYGQPLFLDQCEICGGIWFDELELYKARQGEAEKIETLNSEILLTPTLMENKIHLCPKDQAKLFRFTDKYFPAGIIVERCPKCDGFWLNHGEFTKYQKARQELLRPKERTPEDIKLEEDIKQILAANQTGSGNNDVLKKLGQFLSTPIDEETMLPATSAETSPKVENTVNLVMNVLTTLLRLFVFR